MKSLQHAPTISVIALDSQEYPLHPKTLYSLFTQQMDDWELFLITDGLSDPIEEITRRANDSRITIFSGHTSQLLELWNTSLQQSSGDFITYLSSGLVYYPTHFQLLAQSLLDHDDVVLTYTDQGVKDPGYQLHPGKLMHHRFEDVLINQAHENPLMDYWSQLHNKGAFGRIANTTWNYVKDFEERPFQLTNASPLTPPEELTN